jgi:hypothetical protein
MTLSQRIRLRRGLFVAESQDDIVTGGIRMVETKILFFTLIEFSINLSSMMGAVIKLEKSSYLRNRPWRPIGL